jgi:hypothetical protein
MECDVYVARNWPGDSGLVQESREMISADSFSREFFSPSTFSITRLPFPGGAAARRAVTAMF